MSAIISECGLYRYVLTREVGTMLTMHGAVNFIMLNPSTADATEDDPTIRRCMRFAEDWGFMRLIVTNLFAFRATDPREMVKAADPIGPQNDDHIRESARVSDLIVYAWGVNGTFRDRPASVDSIIRGMGRMPSCLKVTKDGHPQHPLYMAASTKAFPFPSIHPKSGV